MRMDSSPGPWERGAAVWWHSRTRRPHGRCSSASSACRPRSISRRMRRPKPCRAAVRVYVYQPALGDEDALIAKALKGAFFEAVLASPARRDRGGQMPLALLRRGRIPSFHHIGQRPRRAEFFGSVPQLWCGLRARHAVGRQRPARPCARGGAVARHGDQASADQHGHQNGVPVDGGGRQGTPGRHLSRRGPAPRDRDPPAVGSASRRVLCVPAGRAFRAAPTATFRDTGTSARTGRPAIIRRSA